MRGLLQLIALLAVVFFVVGHFFGGWYLGVAAQTPVLVYHKDHVATLERRTLSRTDFPFTVKGRLREGTLTVEGIYERPTSFQNPNQQTEPPRVFFEETFGAGDYVNVSELLEEGPGIYAVRLTFEDATGLFRVDVPKSSEL